jgi:4-amino-4-deoxy-L-arabinose transferase-like glycosyltransferase
MLRKNWVLILILTLAIFLRFNRLDYLELFGDEVDAGYQAYSLAETGRDYKGHLLPLYAQSFSEWRAPLMMYAMVPFIKAFGLNEWGVRGYSAFFGIISILGFYFLLRKIGIKKSIAILSVLLLAITPWHIQYSRTAFELTLLASLIIWGLYFLIDYLLSNKAVFKIIVAAILLSLSFYTYNTANVYVPLLLLVTAISYFLVKREIVWKPFLGLLTIMFFLSLPILIQIFAGHGADRFRKFSVFGDQETISTINNYRTVNENSFLSKIYYNKPVMAVKKIIFNYTTAFSSDFLFNRGDVTFRHSLHMVGNLFWIEAILIIIGLIVFIKKENKVLSDWFMLGFLIIAPIPSSLTIDGAYHASRLFLMIFPLTYFAANGLLIIFKYKKTFGLLAILVLLAEFSYFQYYYWTSYRQESWRWWHYGYKEVFSELKINETNYEKALIENTYEPALVRYLFWNKIDPKLVFGINDKMKSKEVEGFDGFCLNQKICFVDFNGKIIGSDLKPNYLYLINQEKNIGGDWDWSKNPPKGVVTISRVNNLENNPLFYLVTGSNKR